MKPAKKKGALLFCHKDLSHGKAENESSNVVRIFCPRWKWQNQLTFVLLLLLIVFFPKCFFQQNGLVYPQMSFCQSMFKAVIWFRQGRKSNYIYLRHFQLIFSVWSLLKWVQLYGNGYKVRQFELWSKKLTTLTKKQMLFLSGSCYIFFCLMTFVQTSDLTRQTSWSAFMQNYST